MALSSVAKLGILASREVVRCGSYHLFLCLCCMVGGPYCLGCTEFAKDMGLDLYKSGWK